MKKITQIISADPSVRAAWYEPTEPNGFFLTKLTCIALVEEGTAQTVQYMEMIDDEVQFCHTDAENFLGFIDISESGWLKVIKEDVAEMDKKHGKPVK